MRKWLKGSALALLIVATWLVLPGHAQDTNTLLTQWLTQLRAGTYTIGALATGTKLTNASDGVLTLTNNAGTDFTRLQFGGTTASFPALKRNGVGVEVKLADDSAFADLTVANIKPFNSYVTNGGGTGVTVNQYGSAARLVYKATVDKTAFVAAAVTADVTIATLPAKTSLLSVYADLTQTFACTAVCTTATLSMTLGSAAGGTQYLASFDADAATGQFGLTDAALGTAMVRAAAIQGGAMSWAGNIVSLRLTSGTGNIGTGTATNLSQGSVTFYLVTERLP